MIVREIAGPQGHFERTGAQSLRDTRSIAQRFATALVSNFSAVLLTVGAGAMVIEPATVEVIAPASLLYAGIVLTRRVKLPMRLPKSARIKDWNYPDPASRKPRMAAGTIYLGRDIETNHELWLTPEDGRQHATIPGTTGAGKTTAIVSFLTNALAQGSGFVLVDGKADNKLYGEILALARRFGREDDVLALNFLVASGEKQSNTFNPFATGNADAIRELLASQLGEQTAQDSNGVFRARAVALIGTIAPVLTWMRDHRGVPISIETIRFCLELRWIWTLATHRIFMVRDPANGKITEYDVSKDMPEDIIYPMQAYLGELPGYDSSVPWNQQKDNKPSEQHGYALMYFTATFTQLAVSLGHIFKVLNGDIDMRDVVLNRRILVVSLPALENSDDTLAALGKIVVASLRGMMAQILGAKLEGDYAQIVENKPGMGVAPFMVVLDELAYYATGGLDRMLAMGRGLNIMFWLAFQEVSGIWARIGEKTASLLGNANLTVAMRQQDAQRTREWLEQTAGQTYVTQATGYQTGELGTYIETQHADVRQVSRIDWRDLQSLIEGEAIILFGGRRIYAKLFHAKFDVSGPMRLNRCLALRSPKLEELEQEDSRLSELIATFQNGLIGLGVKASSDPVLEAGLGAFRQELQQGQSIELSMIKALEAIDELPYEIAKTSPAVQRDRETRPVKTPFTDLLETSRNGWPLPPASFGLPREPIDEQLFLDLVEIEMAIGSSQATARKTALDLLALRDLALRNAKEEPLPRATLKDQKRKLRSLIAEFEAIADSSEPVPA
jgi:intracellular multiplication protein IcmO